MEAATDQADAAYRAVVESPASTASYDSVGGSRAVGGSLMSRLSGKTQRSRNSDMYGHQGVKVLSRSMQQINLRKEPTTQGQDCCIEASSIVAPNAYYFGMIDILQVISARVGHHALVLELIREACDWFRTSYWIVSSNRLGTGVDVVEAPRALLQDVLLSQRSIGPQRDRSKHLPGPVHAGKIL